MKTGSAKMRKAFWKADWFTALLVALVFLFSANSDLIQSLERKAYDWGVLASSRVPSDKIAIIAIDDQSIANLGRWPWPRAIQGRMLDILADGHAKVVGNTVFFSEPQIDPGLDYINKIGAILANSSLKHSNPDEWNQLDALLQDALQHLDNDQKLADSMAKANDVLLGMYFELGEPQGKPDSPLPDYVLKNQSGQYPGRRRFGFALPFDGRADSYSGAGLQGAGPRPPQCHAGRGWRCAHRAVGDRLFRPILPIAVTDAGSQKPES